jgi:hypothetical protein
VACLNRLFQSTDKGASRTALPNRSIVLYIVAIAWLYVTLMMALMEKNWVAGILTFFFFGLFPCALLLWLFGSPLRRKVRRKREDAAANQALPAAPTVYAAPLANEADKSESAYDHVHQDNGADADRH